ncbi:MAG TPA: NADH-quinone oxidoreductase subunit M [Methanomassiliicoccales archaeon]|nr:NADH-quinone oxidoreductase subunit M [Methanomassiliicoccales archaeon]
MELPILSLLLLFPLIGAVITFMMGKNPKMAKISALVFSAIPLVLSLLMLTEYVQTAGGYQFKESFTWIESLGISYILGVDGISVPMVFLTTLLVFLAIIFSWDIDHRTNQYMGLMLVLELGVLGVFMALDYFLFYIFWEVVLIPMYFLINVWGGPRRGYAAIKFFIYTHVASLVMLLGIFALYFEAASVNGFNSFSMETINAVSPFFGNTFQVIVFGALFFGFAVKMPSFPFHTWLPDAHVEAPTGGSVLLAGLLLKMGSYGVIRIAFPALPDGAHEWQWVMVALAILSIVYGAIMCLAQKDLKKMVAYSSISHMGIVMLGFATFTELGIAAGVLQMFAHGLITAVLFMMCGVVQHKTGTRNIPRLGGLAAKMPFAATFMMIGFLASLGLPGMVGFVAEFSVFTATFDAFGWLLLIPITSVAITAGYYIWAMQRTLFGPLTKEVDVEHLHDVYWFEALPLAVLSGFIVLFGMFPALVLDYIRPALGAVIGLLGGI